MFNGSSGEVSMVSRTSEDFHDLRGQIFTNVAVYKVCDGQNCWEQILS